MLLSMLVILTCNIIDIYAITSNVYEKKSYDEYLQKIGFPSEEINNLSENNKKFMVKYLKNQQNEFLFEKVEKKTVSVNNKSFNKNLDSKLIPYNNDFSVNHAYRSISKDKLELGVYYLHASNNIERTIIYPYFKWKNSGFIPHIIRNDSFSYSINANDWDIIPNSLSLCVDHIVDSHIYTKEYSRPSMLTWTGATYKIPRNSPLYGKSGMAAFAMKCTTGGKADPRIILHYVDDESITQSMSYSVNVSEALSVSISYTSSEAYTETSEMFNMFKNIKKR